MKKITAEVLKKWGACKDGYDGFNRLFPNGADLETAIDGLISDNHDNWAYWLFCHARENKVFKEVVAKGYRNTGDRNTGDRNTGDRNTGDRNTGDRNTGNWNTGDLNTGNLNTGDRNTGNLNTGNLNTGNWNTGNWNTGDRNTGYFNTNTPENILAFNKPCKREKWDKADKPSFIYFGLTYWVDESQMTDAEKAADPNFHIRGGQLRSRTYAEAWALAWKGASTEDKELLLALPNFDAEVFKEISGIDVRIDM